MAESPNLDYFATLHLLTDHQIDFIIVGGVSAVLNGATYTTFDIDIVPSQESKNLDRLFSALSKIHAIFRDPAGRTILLERSHLDPGGHVLLMTDNGPIDVMGYIGKKRGYEQLLNHVVMIDCDQMKLRVLDLETLIQSKEETGRKKDKESLSLLKSVLKEMKKKN